MATIQVYFKNKESDLFDEVISFQEPTAENTFMTISCKISKREKKRVIIPAENINYYEIFEKM